MKAALTGIAARILLHEAGAAPGRLYRAILPAAIAGAIGFVLGGVLMFVILAFQGGHHTFHHRSDAMPYRLATAIALAAIIFTLNTFGKLSRVLLTRGLGVLIVFVPFLLFLTIPMLMLGGTRTLILDTLATIALYNVAFALCNVALRAIPRMRLAVTAAAARPTGNVVQLPVRQ